MVQGRRRVLHGWGGARFARSIVYRPSTVAAVATAVRYARGRGLDITHRGAGQSYGDAALNQGGAVIQMTGLDRILQFDEVQGVVKAQAGVTIGSLWKRVLPRGWWPPVVPGTSRPTLGGCVAMNVHGKNHPKVGALGRHVLGLTILTPGGDIRELDATDDQVSLRRHIGAQGLLGTILDVTLRLRRVHSGYLAVESRTSGNLDETLTILQVLSRTQDYAVAWIDAFAQGEAIGRGQVHGARHLPTGDPQAGEAMTVEEQLSSKGLPGALSRERLPAALRLVLSDSGVRLLNAIKYVSASVRGNRRYLQTHAAFHFLLDYLPGWQRAYAPGGLIQYQLFVPEGEAAATFRRALELGAELERPSYLAVMKKHTAEPGYPATRYAVDGCSLALDFPVRSGENRRLMELMEELDRMQDAAGGHVYPAKDAVSRVGRLGVEPPEGYASNLSRRWKRNA